MLSRHDLIQRFTPFTIDAHHLIAEEIITGVQANIDGHRHNGKNTILGIVDEVMCPGTQAFLRCGASLAREIKWRWSYRYAAIYLGGASSEDLHQRYDEICRALSFD
jgi:hypothetical protein